MKLILLAGIVGLSACNHYYKATQLHTPDQVEKAAAIDSLQKLNKYFLLRNGDKTHFMRNATVSTSKQWITSILQNPGVDHRLHLVNGRHGKLIYDTKIPHDRHVLNEVHFYITPGAKTTAGPNNLYLNNIQKIEVIEKDKKRTTQSTFVGLLVGVVGVFGLLVTFFVSLFM